MRSRVLFVGLMLFLSVVYYIMAYGQPTSNTLVHGFEASLSSGPSQQLQESAALTSSVNVSRKVTDVTQNKSSSSTTTSKNVSVTVGTIVSDQSFTALTNSSVLEPITNSSDDAWNNLTLSDASTYLINNPGLCQKKDGETLRVVILVVTAPQNVESRQAIRQTWGMVARTEPHFRIAFALGRPASAKQQAALTAENARHSDLVQGSFLDTYYNLTMKTLMLFKWSREFCQSAEFVLKIDDDCFLNPGNLLAFLAAPRKEKTDRVIYGRVWQKVKPIRDKKDKWAVTKEQFAGEVFPDYVGGPTYVVSRSAVPALLDASSAIPMLDLEDVYLTGLCAERAKVARVSDVKFGVPDTPTVCASRDVITYHRVSPSAFYMLWWFIHDTRFETCSAKDKTSCGVDKNRMVFDLLNAVTKHLPPH